MKCVQIRIIFISFFILCFGAGCVKTPEQFQIEEKILEERKESEHRREMEKLEIEKQINAAKSDAEKAAEIQIKGQKEMLQDYLLFKVFF